MLIPLDQALAAVRARARPLPAEPSPLAGAYGRVLAEQVRARRDQPATDISMMDGYALRAADAVRSLRVGGEIAAGDAPWTRALQPGEAARIFTGAPLPPGADCVVMQEHAEREGETVRVQLVPKAGQHIRRRGEELHAGAAALPAGRLLDASDLALAAACGASTVQVHRRPRVAILCTGSELVPVGEDPPPATRELDLLGLGGPCVLRGRRRVLLVLAPRQEEEREQEHRAERAERHDAPAPVHAGVVTHLRRVLPAFRAEVADRAPLVEARSRALDAVHGSGSGFPAAPADDRLRLLPSGPDLVHGPTSRGDPDHRRRKRRCWPRTDAPRGGVQPR